MTDKVSRKSISEAENSLRWDHEIADIPASGLETKRAANEQERSALAGELRLVACESLDATYRLRPAPANGYRLRGKLVAEVVQSCVVTLAPVHETVHADFDVEFRPRDQVPTDDDEFIDIDDATDVEAYIGTAIPVGRIVFEELSAALNPYPRRPGAQLDPQANSDPATQSGKDNPFSVLAKLKQSSPTSK